MAQAPSLFVDSRSTTAEAADRLDGPAKDDALFLSRFPSASWLAYGSPDIVEAKARGL
jgi:endoglucanase